MGILSENSIVGASYKSPEHYDYKIDNSLKFNDDDSAYLSRTFGTPTNDKIFTYSCWYKRGNITTTYREILFYGGNNGADYGSIYLHQNSQLRVSDTRGTNATLMLTSKLRDPSAWYNIVVSFNSTEITASDRIKIYINGVRNSTFDSSWQTFPSLNDTFYMNSAYDHMVGNDHYAITNSLEGQLEGCLAEVNFIDGQALTPSDFGEADADYGDWKPKEYTGTHGNNGFYLPFKQDATVEGFSAVAYTGDGTTSHLIQGIGYQPDMVWLKTRTNQADSHYLADAVRGGSYHLRPESGTWGDLGSSTTFDPDGFTLGQNDGQSNSSSNTYIAWTWDMGGTTVSNTNGSITSSTRASSTYGQSITTYTGNGTAGATIGHGLSSAPEMVWVKSRSGASDFRVGTTVVTGKAMADGNGYYTELNSNGGLGNPGSTGGTWNETNPTSTVVTMGNNGSHNGSGSNYVMYCFHSVTGYSKIGTYTGDATTNGSLSVTTGFRPAFLMVKKTNGTGNWIMVDSARNVDPNNINKYLKVNTTDVDATSLLFKFTSTGFTIHSNLADINSSGGEYIYMAFADTREYSFFTDKSTNSNHWTPNNISSVADVMLDSPTNNFPTLNPLNQDTEALSEGSLQIKSRVGGSGDGVGRGTIGFSSGKWYAEYLYVSGGNGAMPGISPTSANMTVSTGNYYAFHNGNKVRYIGNTYTDDGAFGATFAAGDILGIVMDADNGTISYYKNNSLQGGGSAYTGLTDEYTFSQSTAGGAENIGVWNFGQDSSFAGNKTAQGNQDSNSIGDFYYAPPTDFLALCSANLPDPTVKPSEHFNTVTYTGTGSSGNSRTDVGFEPNMVWIKRRDSSGSHMLHDVVRGVNKRLRADTTETEDTGSSLSSFDSTGFTLGSSESNTNASSSTYVAWNWKSGGAAVSNTAGSITSSVSANVDAGFSIVKYSGNSTSGATVGHGLAKAPDIVIIKSTDQARDWMVWHENLSASPDYNDFVRLNTTDARQNSSGVSDAILTAVPSASLLTLASFHNVNRTGYNFIAYAFHSVDGYSKVGSYTGNGIADGTFVHTGFRPAYVLIKRTNVAQDWMMFDNTRNTYNATDLYLQPNNASIEASATGEGVDLLSNGFKARNDSATFNASGSILIYLAFAEMPFKWTNAR